MSKDHLIELLQRPDKRAEFINDHDQIFEMEDDIADMNLSEEGEEALEYVSEEEKENS